MSEEEYMSKEQIYDYFISFCKLHMDEISFMEGSVSYQDKINIPEIDKFFEKNGLEKIPLKEGRYYFANAQDGHAAAVFRLQNAFKAVKNSLE